MKYYNNYIDLIGNTPIVKLNNIDFKSNVFAKMELLNPGGSVKDRMGRAVIEAAEKSGKLKRGGTIIEVTAGNTGIGIALAAIGKGYNIIFFVPLKFSQEKQDIMRILGAKIVNTPKDLGMQGAFEEAQKLLDSHPEYLYIRQFENQANPESHFKTTGPEIWDDLDGNVDYLVAGAGSGGTITGVGRYLKSKNPNVKIILADPQGSTMGGGVAGCYGIEGIGNTFMPKTMDMSIVDEIFKITDEESLFEIKELAKKEGILSGTSSGAALAGVRKLGKVAGNVVVILPDRGDRYLSKGIFN
ncbi:MAG: cysteine synthase family protein [Rickettsiales bacterium]|jgi:cysteine synthase A|nr:cysteine synthase family protein [Rickettsiales bacterium]